MYENLAWIVVMVLTDRGFSSFLIGPQNGVDTGLPTTPSGPEMLDQIGIKADANRYFRPWHDRFCPLVPIVWNAFPIGIAGDCPLYVFVRHGFDASNVGAALTTFGQLAKLIRREAFDVVFVHFSLLSGAR